MSSARRSASFGFSELSGNTACTPRILDRLLELRKVAGRRLPLGRGRREHGADGRDPVPLREVDERVVVGDDLPVGLRDAVDALADRLVHRADLRPVGVGVRGDLRLRVGVGRDQRAPRRRSPPRRRSSDRATNGGRVSPSPALCVTGSFALRSTTFASLPGVLHEVGGPLVELQAAGEHDARIGHGGHVLRPRLVVVRLGVRLEDLLDRDAVAADLAHEVADLRRRRRDRHLPRVARRRAVVVAAAAREAEGAERDHHEGGGRDPRPPPGDDADDRDEREDRRPRGPRSRRPAGR